MLGRALIRCFRPPVCRALSNDAALHAADLRNGLVQATAVQEQYNRDGYVVVRSVLGKDLISEVQGHVAWLLHQYPDIPPEQLHHPLIQHDAFWLRVVSDAGLLKLAEFFVGPDIGLFASHYFCKMPHTGKEVLWHQDGAYWPLEPMDVVSMWLAVDPSNKANGCLRVVRGSHKTVIKELTPSKDGDNVLGSYTDISIDADSINDIELEPGDVEIHHPNIVHGSHANTSEHRRCGLTIRYIPTTTHITVGHDHPIVPMNWLLQGRAKAGINQYRPWPAFNPDYSYPFSGCTEWNGRSEVTEESKQLASKLTRQQVQQENRANVFRVIKGLEDGY